MRAGYLSLTRGDGGQNLIGAEQGPLLGPHPHAGAAGRARASTAPSSSSPARATSATRRRPTRRCASGASDAMLADVVWVIRRFQPDVIITRFSPEAARDARPPHRLGDAGGRGVHARRRSRASPRAAAAGRRRGRRGASSGTAARSAPSRAKICRRFAKLDVGGYNPLLGVSYGEMAARQPQHAQEPGLRRGAARGAGARVLPAAGGRADAARASSTASTSRWARVPGGEKLRALLVAGARRVRSRRAARSVPTLVDAPARWRRCPRRPGRRTSAPSSPTLIAACAGLFVEATAHIFARRPGTAVEVTATAVDRSPVAVTLDGIRLAWASDQGRAAAPAGRAAGRGQRAEAAGGRPRRDQPVLARSTAGARALSPADPAFIGLPRTAPSPQVTLLPRSAGASSPSRVRSATSGPIRWLALRHLRLLFLLLLARGQVFSISHPHHARVRATGFPILYLLGK